jgi:hypothetical protein
MRLETLGSEATAGGFDEGVGGGLFRSAEVEPDAALVGPQIQVACTNALPWSTRIVAGNPISRPTLSSTLTTSMPRKEKRQSASA